MPTGTTQGQDQDDLLDPPAPPSHHGGRPDTVLTEDDRMADDAGDGTTDRHATADRHDAADKHVTEDAGGIDPADSDNPADSGNPDNSNDPDDADEQTERRRVGRNSLVMFSGTLASRLTGQIRTILLAAAIGVSGIAADAYQVGSQIPTALFNLLSGGIINAILVPQIVRAFRHKDSQDRINKLLTLSGTILIAFTALLMLLSPALILLYSSNHWSASQHALAESFTLWCMPQVFFYGLYTVLGQVLAAKDRFGMYAWSSVAANLISSAGFTAFILLFGNASKQPVSFWTTDKIALTAGMWTAGVAAQALLLLIPMHKLGLHYRIRWGVHGIGLRSMGKVAGWSMAMVVLDELLNVFVTRITTTAPVWAQKTYNHEIPGSQAYMQGYQIWILPYSLIAVSIATAIFPVLSRAAARNDTARAGHTLTHALKQSGVLMFFFSAVFVALPIPVIRALLPSVSVHDAHLVASALIGLAFSLPFSTITLYLRRTFYAYEDGRTPFLLSLVLEGSQAVFLLIGIFVFPPSQWAFMVGLALLLSNLVMTPFAVHLLHRRIGASFETGPIMWVYAKSFLAAMVDIVAGYWLTNLLVRVFGCSLDQKIGVLPWWKAVVICVIVGVAMLALYIALLRLLRTEGTDAFMAVLGRFLPGRRGAGSVPSRAGTQDRSADKPRTPRRVTSGRPSGATGGSSADQGRYHPAQYNGTDPGAASSPAADGTEPPVYPQAQGRYV